MSIYAIGDLHLHFGCELKAKDQLTDPAWKNHEERLYRYCVERIHPEDTLVLVGDHSFGKTMAECKPDFDYIRSLPGKKVLIRGNHDMFWDAKKTAKLNREIEGMTFLQGNYVAVGNVALVGTKGFTFEGPYYLNRRGQVAGWDEEKKEHADRIIERELDRLEASFRMAQEDGFTRFLMFLHYPPTNILESKSDFTWMAERYGAEQVIYAHSHGEARFHDSIQGMNHGIQYRLVSGDYLRWRPEKILE